jgi:hypothetical protein
MRITSPEPFWTRMGLSRQVAAAWLVPAGVLAALAWWLATTARRAGLTYVQGFGEDGFGPPHPLLGHVIAMTLVGGVAVALAATFVRAENPLIASAVLLGAAGGPMTAMAAPIRTSLIEHNGETAAAWWRILVTGMVFAVLAGWTAVVTCALRGRALRGRPAALSSRIAGGGVFVALALTAYAVNIGMVGESTQHPAVLTNAGWAVLLAGLVCAASYGPWWSACFSWGFAGAALGVMYLAYERDGGWPGVSGWEVAGQPPIVLSAWITLLLVASIPVALALRTANSAVIDGRIAKPAPPTATAVS